jgi:hypothetical protein
MTRARFHRRIRKTEAWRLAMLVLGIVLLLATPFVAMLPGPGGIFVFAAGLALILGNSAWARRRYVHAKRRWPRLGHFSDLSLRRRSARRRQARRQALRARQAAFEAGQPPQAKD